MLVQHPTKRHALQHHTFNDEEIGMLVNKTRIASLFLGLSMLTTCVLAADYGREQRWAAEVLPGLIVGEPVYLTQANGHQFLGLYGEADSATIAIIVVHGMGLHPDWGIIGTLRRELYDAGYTTLSIQMPILAADASYKEYLALFPEAVERLQLAVQHLKHQSYRKIAIVSHSNGSRMSRQFMKKNPADVTTWVALSLTQGDTFAGIQAPILDLYGENDLGHVLHSAAQRRDSLNHPASAQIIIPGANHFFSQREPEMFNQVKRFLKPWQ
jgi:pimeloyl-ACP methyl ester carboxylesterase